VQVEHCIWARNGNTPCPHTAAPVQDDLLVGYFKQDDFRRWVECSPLSSGAQAFCATPPAAQRQWVGLTQQDKHDLLPKVQLKDEDPKAQVWLTRKDAFAYADAIEAKLCEKNGGGK
jgi:hypothetical protein